MTHIDVNSIEDADEFEKIHKYFQSIMHTLSENVFKYCTMLINYDIDISIEYMQSLCDCVMKNIDAINNEYVFKKLCHNVAFMYELEIHRDDVVKVLCSRILLMHEVDTISAFVGMIHDYVAYNDIIDDYVINVIKTYIIPLLYITEDQNTIRYALFMLQCMLEKNVYMFNDDIKALIEMKFSNEMQKYNLYSDIIDNIVNAFT